MASGGVELHASVLLLDPYTVATVPPAASHTNCVIYVSDGVAGGPGLAFSNGTDWKRVDTPATTIAAA